MQFLKPFIFLLITLQITFCKAQDYKFIPSDQHLLSNDEIKTMQIKVTPDVLLFSERGEILPKAQMELMANPNYTPLFYANTQGQLKSIIFKQTNSTSTRIEKSPEAYFETGEKALDFIVSDIEGNTTKLSNLKGKVVVLNFWFTKCGPCVMEIPSLNNVVDTFKSEAVVFIAITFNKKDPVKQFLKEHKFDYKIAPNANDIITMYGVQSYPTNIVINQKGEIVLKELGYRTNIESVLTQSIKSLLD
ncbi:TlpA family protein disulfide reductase [Pontimicrobium sp. MEBiC06410]